VSRANSEITGPEARDREGDDRDQAAWLRDRSALARDREADERDRIAQDRMQAAAGGLQRARIFLQAGAPGNAGVSREEADGVIRLVLDHLDDALRDDARDRRDAACDRRAALADRQTAAEDRVANAARREQAAVERAQDVLVPAATGPGRAEQLYARVASARAQAQALCQRAREMQSALPPRQDVLRRSGHARLLARLETMPVIEQAKGIIMSQSGCGEQEAFDVLRRASQRGNVPVRELAAKIVANASRSASAKGPGPTAVPSPSQ
jgi:AmiR/NasT family two-component response regulator